MTIKLKIFEPDKKHDHTIRLKLEERSFGPEKSMFLMMVDEAGNRIVCGTILEFLIDEETGKLVIGKIAGVDRTYVKTDPNDGGSAYIIDAKDLCTTTLG